MSGWTFVRFDLPEPIILDMASIALAIKRGEQEVEVHFKGGATTRMQGPAASLIWAALDAVAVPKEEAKA